MKVIITENQYSLMRRVSQVENSIRPVMDNVYEYLQFGNPTPLNMGEYDTFIHVISTKISNQIINNESIFDPDKKEALKKQIQRFIETEYIDMVREYLYSRMDKKINESTHDLKFKRRYQEIEDGISDFILTHKLTVMDTFDNFLTEICWDVAQDVVSKMNIPEDDYVMYRNQLIRFIKNNFYEELKEFWDRNHYWDDSKNINESYDKIILKENNFHLRRRENIMKEKLDSIIQNRFTNEEFQFMPFEHFRLHISDYVGTEMANELNLTGEKRVTFRNQIIQYVRNNFYEYLKEIWESKQNINESYDKIIFQRRYQQISEFIDRALSRYDVCLYTDVIDFVDRVMDYTADNLYDSLFNYNWDDGDEFYQPMYDFISDHFVDRIHEFYEDNKHFCIDEDGNWIH